MMAHTKTISLALLLLAQTMVGVCIVGSKSLLTSIPPMVILNIRFIIGFLFLIFAHFILGKETVFLIRQLDKKDWLFIFTQALCAGAFFNILLLWGLNYTSANIAGIITSALPAIVAILSVIFLKEHLTTKTIARILLVILGLLIINSHNFHEAAENNIFGDIIILISLVPEAAYYVLSKIHKNKLPIFLMSALMNGINIPIFTVLSFFIGNKQPLNLSSSNFTLLILVGIASALFYVFWFLGSKHIKGSTAGLTTAFMPIATLLMAWLFLGETITIIQAVGMSLVLLSIGIQN